MRLNDPDRSDCRVATPSPGADPLAGSTQQFFSSSAVLFGARAFGACAGFVSQILLAHALPAEDLGTFFLATSIAAVLGLVAATGYPDVAIRFFVRYREHGQSKLLAAFVRRCRVSAMWASLAGIVATGMVALLSTESVEGRWAIALGALSIPAFALNWINSAYAVAVKQFALSQLPDIVGRPFLFLLAIATMLLLGIETSVVTLVALTSAIAIGMTALQAAWLSPHLGIEKFDAFRNKRAIRLWRKASAPFIIVALFTSLFADLDLALLGAVLHPSDLAVFGVCLKLAFLVGFVIQVVQQFAAPDIAASYLRSDTRHFERAVANANYVCVGATVGILIGVIVLGDYILAAFGPNFVAGHVTLVVLTLAQVIRALFGPNVQCLTVIGAGRRLAIVSASAVIVLAALNLLLAPRYGIFGAGVAVALTILFWTAALAIALHRLANLRTDILASLLVLGKDRRAASLGQTRPRP
jgi:O-antigen/teichoic acid export membrane protein